MRTVDAPLSAQGGYVDVPASDGVAAEILYPSNDACVGSTVHISGLGPAGVNHLNFLDSIFQRGQLDWQPFYLLKITLKEPCSNRWLIFTGFPHLVLRSPNARAGTMYYADLALQVGNSTHIPLGPPGERDSKHVDFDFGMLPLWAQRGRYLGVPLGPMIQLVIARQ